MSGVSLRGRRVGPGARCYVVADAGRRHDGDVQLGYKLIEIAGAAGADAVAFDRGGPGAEALQGRDFKALFGHARFVGLTLIAAPSDLEAFELVASLDPDAIRLSLGDAPAQALLPRAAALGRPLLLRCAGAPESVVRRALEYGPAVLLAGSGEEIRLLAGMGKDVAWGAESAAVTPGAHLVQTPLGLGGASDLRALVAAIRLAEPDGGPRDARPLEGKTT